MARKKQLDATQSAEVTAEVPGPELDVPFTEHEAPVEANEAPLELVTTPGPKKTIRFEGDGPAQPPAGSGGMTETGGPSAAPAMDDWNSGSGPSNASGTSPGTAHRRPPEGLQDIHAGVDRLGPDPNFPGRPRGASLAPVSIRSRTVYTTERGGEVRSYESPASGARTITLAERGREVPFHSSMVDSVVGEPASNGNGTLGESPTDSLSATEETPQSPAAETTPEEAKPRRRFGFFGRRKPKIEFKADGKGDPSIDHTYIPAQAVDSLPEAATPAPVTATRPPATQAPAWDPGHSTGTSQEVVFEERAPEAALDTTWQAPRPVTRRGPRPSGRRTTHRAPTKRTPKRKAPKRSKGLLAYPGDNHPVIDVEGIGPTYAKRLEKAGILTTGQLAVAQPGRLAKKVNAPKKTVQGWKAQADLLKVKGVGPQFAEAMARAGIDGIDGLKAKSPAKVAAQVTKYLGSLGTNVVGQPVTPKRVAKWQAVAKRMRRTKTTPAQLATPTHGIPPPWLREGAGKPAASRSGRAARRTSKAASRKKR